MPALTVETIAGGLSGAWGVEVLPDGRYIVTEIPGSIKLIARDGTMEEVAGAPEVLARGQGGLLDVALAEDFETSRRLYLSYAKPVGFDSSATAVATAVLEEGPARLTGLEEIFLQTPASRDPKHYGSRIVLDGPFAYITVGERSNLRDRERAQDLDATYGKVIRLRLDGGVPTDNPFFGQDGAIATVYSLGHRNPQGADLHPETGELWTLEHGPAGGDELNRIEAGANYGWPVVSYGENYNGSPVGSGRKQR